MAQIFVGLAPTTFIKYKDEVRHGRGMVVRNAARNEKRLRFHDFNIRRVQGELHLSLSPAE
jgi:hypothetical protein